jgi:acetyl-CoA carboxylase carboxyl transferase subunit beta
MAWFKRKEKGITTATEDKMDVPKGLWYKSPTKIIDADELERNLL